MLFYLTSSQDSVSLHKDMCSCSHLQVDILWLSIHRFFQTTPATFHLALIFCVHSLGLLIQHLLSITLWIIVDYWCSVVNLLKLLVETLNGLQWIYSSERFLNMQQPKVNSKLILKNIALGCIIWYCLTLKITDWLWLAFHKKHNI